MASISNKAPFGRPATATQERAGKSEVKYLAYTSLLHTDTVTGTLPGGIVLAIIITVVEIVLGLKMKKQKESVR